MEVHILHTYANVEKNQSIVFCAQIDDIMHAHCLLGSLIVLYTFYFDYLLNE